MRTDSFTPDDMEFLEYRGFCACGNQVIGKLDLDVLAEGGSVFKESCDECLTKS